MTPAAPDYPSLRRIGWPWAGEAEDADWQALAASHPGARPAREREQHRTGYEHADAEGNELWTKGMEDGRLTLAGEPPRTCVAAR